MSCWVEMSTKGLHEWVQGLLTEREAVQSFLPIVLEPSVEPCETPLLVSAAQGEGAAGHREELGRC